MKYILFVIGFPALLSDTCKKKNTADNIPVCIQTRIDSIRNEPRWNPPAQVDEYEYSGKTVYLFSSNCCDQYNIVLDANCQYICAPTGGITGKGDGQCADFTCTARHLRLVWKDAR